MYGTRKLKTYCTSLCIFVKRKANIIADCSAGKCRIAGKRHKLRKMSHSRREMSQSAENVVNPTTDICRIVDGKYRKKIRCRYMSQHRREMSQLLLILHFDDFEFICD